jgi:tetratricopeptide (TPR) repeat protein
VTNAAKIGCGIAAAVIVVVAAATSVGIYYLVSFNHGRVLFEQGRAAMNRCEYETAISRFDAALRTRLSANYLAYTYGDRAYCRRKRGQRDEALRDNTEAIRLNPRLVFAYEARGDLYEEKGETDKAIQDYTAAIRINPNATEAFYRRAFLFRKRRETDKAIADFSEAIRSSPNYTPAYAERGASYADQGDLDRALASLDAAIDLWPRYAWAYYQRGAVYRRKGNLEKAINDFTEAIRLNPKGENALEIRGSAYSKKGDHDRAVADFSALIRLKPTRRAYDHRARAYAKKGDYALAVADFKQARQLGEVVTISVKGLAWLRSTCPDASFRNGKEAVADATKDCEATRWKSWSCLDTLAAAHAEDGNFEDAIKYQQQALGMEAIPDQRAAMEKRLALYQKHLPFRELNKPVPGETG